MPITANDLRTSVADLVNQNPNMVAVCERLAIDYCCGGKQSLESACLQKGLDPILVLKEIAQVEQPNAPVPHSWQRYSAVELCDHLEKTHHAYLRRELPLLRHLICKVREAHRANHPELDRLSWTFDCLQAELMPHLMKEEMVLFPIIRRLDQATELPTFHCGKVENPICVMEEEHQRAGVLLEQIRQYTNNFALPNDACPSYRLMLRGLMELEQDLHQHMHKENNVLFPMAAKRESELALRQS